MTISDSPPVSAGIPRAMLGAALGMALVGMLPAVSKTIEGYPALGGQAVRYAAAAALLGLLVRRAGAPPVRLRARDLVLLAALAATGLAGFNLCVLAAVRDTSPATTGTVIGASPVVLAVAAPLLARRARPAPAVVAGAVAVAAGAALATGFGDATARGLAFSAGALAGEVCFSLLAVPLLPRLGPLRVSAYTAALAAPMLLAAGVAVDGTGVVRVPSAEELAGLLFLAVVITTVAFVLWYGAVARIGADRAGLFTGVLPVSAVATTVVCGLGTPGPAALAGSALVAAGVVAGVAVRPGRPEARAGVVTCRAAPIGTREDHDA
ncbi:DMT family transporter [Actinomadura atramentaria]|uniref:DMT family transporter n=1 Tax=Actinomadura atramentaria TaxID=1990 RepID=UPI00035DB48F|nr:DMT family transporter [Actinomadura atramentaria]